MSPGEKVDVAIVAFNESKALEQYLPSLITALSPHQDRIGRIRVLDDGSIDESKSTVENTDQGPFSIEFDPGMENVGYSRNTARAFTDLGDSLGVIIVDGDGQYPAEDLPRMFHQIFDAGVDLLLPIRLVRDERIQRKLGSTVLRLLFLLHIRRWVPDLNGGSKYVSARLAKLSIAVEKSPLINPELLVVAERNELKVDFFCTSQRARLDGGQSRIISNPIKMVFLVNSYLRTLRRKYI